MSEPTQDESYPDTRTVQSRPEIDDPGLAFVDWWNLWAPTPPEPWPPCPDCGSQPWNLGGVDPLLGGGGWRAGSRSAGTLEQAAAMPEARCPNRRHATFRRFWKLELPT